MQFVRYTYQGSQPQWGVVDDGDVYTLADLPNGEPDYTDIATDAYRALVRRRVNAGGLPSVPETEVRRLAPVPEPGKIVCVGLNYHDHAEEGGAEVPDRPMLFSKAPTAVTNPGDPIYRPAGEDLDYEAELAIVVGHTATDVAPEDVPDHVAGYTALNDVSARKAQSGDGQFHRGKSFDSFGPMGPRLVTGDDFDPNAADIGTRVNGETRQDSNTEKFVFDTNEVVSFISESMTLRPGDVVATGTPAGVGLFVDDGLLEAGDEVEVEIEDVGVLDSHVVERP